MSVLRLTIKGYRRTRDLVDHDGFTHEEALVKISDAEFGTAISYRSRNGMYVVNASGDVAYNLVMNGYANIL